MIAGLSSTTRTCSGSSKRLARALSSLLAFRSMIRPTRSTISSSLNGLIRESRTPSLAMRSTFSRPASAVSMTTGMLRNSVSAFSLVSISTPSMIGILRSRIMMSGRSRCAIVSPSTPSAASKISQAKVLNARATIMRIVLLSSTVRILGPINNQISCGRRRSVSRGLG